jgi:hypothetical protein
MNDLTFTLGLNHAAFLARMQQATRSLFAFTAATVGVGSAFRAMQAAVDNGGRLFDVSKRVGSSVGALYQMEQALTQVGQSAESAGSLIMRMQRLAGDPDAAKKLRRIGIDPEAFGRADAGTQTQVAARALAKLGASQQAAMAFSIFGREGAAGILAITRSLDDFNASMEQTKEDAAVWEKNAARFDELGDKLKALQANVGTFFAQVAGGLFDVFDVASNAINAGSYFELLAEGFKGLWNYVIDLGVAAAAAVGEAFYAQVAQMGEQLMRLVQAAKAIPIIGNGAYAAEALLKNAGARSETFGKVKDAALANSSTAFDAFKAMFESFKSPAAVAAASAAGGTGELGSDKAEKRVQVTDLERMGFVMGGGGNPMLDTSRRTAKATERTAKAVEQLLQRGGGEPVNV